MAALTVFEFEVWTATHDHLHAGVVAAEIRKVLVAADSEREAYDTAVAMAWRGDWQVTKVWPVP